MEYKTWSFIKGAITIAALVALQACGGGGDKSTTGTSSAPSSVTASSAPATNSSSSAAAALKVSGVVAADALIGGDIDVAIGDIHFTTTVDAQKSYQIDLTTSAANENTPMVITAQGANSNHWVKLATLLPSVKKLKTLSGADNTLDATEFFGVTINNMTTAEYALAKQSNANIKTDADRTGALLNISAEAQIDMASTLSLLLSDIDYNLPASTATTLDLLMNVNDSKSYISPLKDYGVVLQDEQIAHGNNLLKYSALGLEVDKSQTHLTSSPLEGIFLVESRNTLSVLDFNKDGTGILHSRTILSYRIWLEEEASIAKDIAFSWVKKANKIAIKFPTPIYYGKVDFLPEHLTEWWDSNSSGTRCSNHNDLCDLHLNGIELTLINDSDVSSSMRIAMDIDATDPSGRKTNLSHNEYASMKSMAAFHTPTITELVGKDWYTNTGLYVFNTDFTLAHTDLTTKKTKTRNWKIENNHIVLDSGLSEIWFHSRAEVGFTTLQIDHTDGTNNFMWSIMVPRTPVSMTENDWVGHWSGYGENDPWLQYDFYKNKEWRFGFGPQANNTWSAVTTTNTLQENNGLKTELEVISVVNNHYYTNRCSGKNADVFIPSSCYISAFSINKDFNSVNFGATWINPLFQDQDNRIFAFSYNELKLYDGVSVKTQPFTEVSDNKLYLRKDQKIIELLSSNDQILDVCVYPVFKDCKTNGIKYKFTRGIDITFPAYPSNGWVYMRGYNNVFSNSWSSVSDTKTVAKNASIHLSITANSGYKVGAVSGCDVTLTTGTDYWNNPFYEIPARTTSCELKVDFVPL